MKEISPCLDKPRRIRLTQLKLKLRLPNDADSLGQKLGIKPDFYRFALILNRNVHFGVARFRRFAGEYELVLADSHFYAS